ncbi:hypothetical protein CP972_00845 [Streptomyces prasinus]|uniref:Secreted protein n=1 Tax=Streptomyces prasinus TaxID=67345 RepID=A0ABX6AR68_9ACTN|nr:hypothetical protein CP972_00845 [Streptomyces prasinus]
MKKDGPRPVTFWWSVEYAFCAASSVSAVTASASAPSRFLWARILCSVVGPLPAGVPRLPLPHT